MVGGNHRKSFHQLFFVRSKKISAHNFGNHCIGQGRTACAQNELLRDGTIDVLFANEHELKSLYATADFDSALAAFRLEAALGVVTRSEHGSLVVSHEGTKAIAAHPIDKLVDTTGAGDLFAAGFLLGLARGIDHESSARMGALAAAEVIQHLGARPQTSLKDLAAESGLTIS